MLRLSQRAWNNVLIFAMLFMILLFNTSNNFLVNNDDEPENVPLLPESAVVMSIEFGARKLQRIGQGWRVTPAQQVNEEALHQLVDRWQRTTMQAESSRPMNSPHVIVVWLAGKAEGLVYQFEQQDKRLWVRVQEQTFLVADTNLADLSLPE